MKKMLSRLVAASLVTTALFTFSVFAETDVEVSNSNEVQVSVVLPSNGVEITPSYCLPLEPSPIFD